MSDNKLTKLFKHENLNFFNKKKGFLASKSEAYTQNVGEGKEGIFSKTKTKLDYIFEAGFRDTSLSLDFHFLRFLVKKKF